MIGAALRSVAKLLPGLNHSQVEIRVSPKVSAAVQKDSEGVLTLMETSSTGLSQAEAENRSEIYGPNQVAQEKQHGWTYRLWTASCNALVILLVILATVSYLTDDLPGGTLMMIMVVLGVSLRFIQETKAAMAAAKLKAMISVTGTVIREGKQQEIRLEQIVPGDLIRLSAGDMIPADVRLITAKDLFIIQSSLTGESFPVEKFEAPDTRPHVLPLEFSNICFLGTSVERGTATAVVLATGAQTYFGSMASNIVQFQPQTAFDKGVNKFTWLMLKFMAVMVPLVFVINGLTKQDWVEAFKFGMAVAVGLTPEMLPMIVTVCLSKGAIAMSKKKAIVKRIHSIQNFGAMDVLCTDKTGTLTLDRVILEKHCDVTMKEDDGVLGLAFLNSHFQTGLRNVLDRAVLQHTELRKEFQVPEHEKIDEIPFDFSRKTMSVVVKTPEGNARIITKGAPEQIFDRCTRFELESEILPMDPVLIGDLKMEYEELSADGFRVLAIAYKDMEIKKAYHAEDESELILRGYIAFLDPPKETAPAAIQALQKRGVTIKVLTGDNELVSRKICHEVGLPTEEVVLGRQIEIMSEAELTETAKRATLFARLSPAHKHKIIKALQNSGHVVGFLGDGINDAPALRAADVGISVDTAVDIAKESADLILLEKSLLILEEGVLEGRKVFANILKYIRMGASSNFGNMFSVLGASAFLPYLPMLPIQVLTNNLLYDFSQVPIPTDEVDEEQIVKPRPWHMGELTRFILFIGPISSIFDYTTFFMMLYVFHCWDPSNLDLFSTHSFTNAQISLFQTGWFVESLLTQTLIIHVIRTNKIPFIQSRASWPLIINSALIMAIGAWLPFSPFAHYLGFSKIPHLYWPLVILTLLAYIILTQTVKAWLLRRKWI